MKKLFILLVDDEPINLRVMEMIARLEGHEVESCMDGATALERSRERPFDLIVLDIQMPGMSGLDVARRLGEQPATRSIPILFVSARAGADDRKAGLMAGGSAYLSKPFKRQDLVNAINDLAFPQARQE